MHSPAAELLVVAVLLVLAALLVVAALLVTAPGAAPQPEEPAVGAAGFADVDPDSGAAGFAEPPTSTPTSTPTASTPPNIDAVGAAGFADVDPDSVHAANIDAVGAAGITVGCATAPLRYCPDDSVTRAQMATFLTQALGLRPAVGAAGFADVDPDSVHAANIDAVGAAGITVGCATAPLRYCPDDSVTRAQMATFLTRALGL